MITSLFPLNYVAREGDNVTLMCVTSGGSPDSFMWEKNRTNIGNESIFDLTVVDGTSGGNYTCTVSNSAGTDSASITLYVAPYFTTPLQKQILTVTGSAVNINCDAAGFPSPAVTWMDETNVEISNRSLLEFSPVMFGDEGRYQCVAIIEINGTNFISKDDTILTGKESHNFCMDL